MDLSKEYIDMCEKADLDWTPKKGDFFKFKHWDESSIYDSDYKSGEGEDYFTQPKFWLPRQDQLQEMIDPNFVLEMHRTTKFYLAIPNLLKEDEDKPPSFEDNSFEKVLLKAVMLLKFNKTWDGTEWK